LLKTGVWEGFFEGDTADQERVIDGSSCDFFDTNQILVQQVWIELFNGWDDDLSKEGFVTWEKLWIEGSFGTLDEHVSSFLWSIIELDDKILQFDETPFKGFFVPSDKDLWIHTVFDESLGIFH
jgi:hypothetical protein